MKPLRVRPAPVLTSLLIGVSVSGCSGMVKDRTTTISSDPAGATVVASGIEIGVTPLEVVPDEVFAPRFVGFEYRAAGTLALTKAGCEPVRMQVNDATLARDLHVELNCDPAAAAAAAPAAPATTAPSQPASSADVVSRLETLEALKRRGLVTEAEYDRLRREILKSLLR